jgi:major membrane immunogen (membrane-anchored lipoprotein)
MRNIFLIAIAAICFTSCNNNSNTAKTFCDTTCTNDSLKFNGDSKWKQSLTISIKDCKPDTVSRTYEGAASRLRAPFSNYFSSDIKINKSAIDVAFQDTVSAWVSFNDCITGRGYLLELPFNTARTGIKTSAALNRFDKKFSIDSDLRAYTDRGNIFVVNVTNGKDAQMTFKENYANMDFNDIHKTLDSINVTKSRIYVKLLKDGQEVPLEKNISL